MERRSTKHTDYSTQSKEVIDKRAGRKNIHNRINSVSGMRMDQYEASNRLDSVELLSEKEDGEDGVIEPEESFIRKGMKKKQNFKLNINVQEDGFFEESKLELAEKPVITFNHVCTVTESEQISFEAIKNSGSRSPSPLLEVPSFKIGNKQAVRPPL